MHVPFRIHYRNNLIDKKDSCPIPRPPSWISYGHQRYPSEYAVILAIFLNRIFSSALPQCILYGKYIYTNAKNK
jgi:hypothetical protein